MTKCQCKNKINNSPGNMFPLESRYSIIAGPEFSNISEEQQQQKRPQHQLYEDDRVL